MSGAKHIVTKILTGVPPFSFITERLRRSGSPVFMFHRVLPETEPCYDTEMATSTELFGAFLDWAREQYRVLELGEFVRIKLKGGEKPYCAITFDDGWRDVYLNAFPLLKSRGMPATIFLPVRFMGTSRRFWQDRLWQLFRDPVKIAPMESKLRRSALRFPWCPPLGGEILDPRALRRLLLSRSSLEAEQFVERLEEAAGFAHTISERTFVNWNEVREMQGSGISFGSHTLNHTLLTHCDPQTAEREVGDSRGELAEALGSPSAGFSYPWGATSGGIRDQVRKAEYNFAVTTATQLVGNSTDPYLLPRVAVSSSFLCGDRARPAPERMKFYIARAALHSPNKNQMPSGNHAPGKKLRIALVIDYIDAWEDGGTERQLAKIIAALSPEYFMPELYFLRPSQRIAGKDFPCPVRVASPRPGPKWSRLSVFFNLVRLFRRHQPDVVQTFFRDSTYYGVAAAWIARVPRIVISRRNAGYWKTTRDRMALKLLNRMADFWQCNSSAAFESLRSGESIPAARIEIMPNALDLKRFAPPSSEEKASIRERLGLSSSAPVLVSVANLTPVKDIESLVDAAEQVRGAFPRVKFLVVGEGPLRASLEARAAQKGLSEAVQFVGAQSDVRPFLAAGDMGLLTSRSEGSSNSLLEYMAMGLPSVVSDIPANRELVDGVLFEPGNHASLAHNIIRLLNDRNSCEALKKDYRERISQFSDEVFTQRIQAYYTKIAAERE